MANTILYNKLISACMALTGMFSVVAGESAKTIAGNANVSYIVTAGTGNRLCGQDPDAACRGDITIGSTSWSFPSNRIDWSFNATQVKRPFSPEWHWSLHRMWFWYAMAEAYMRTHDEKYARAFCRQLEDWLDQTGGVPPDKGYQAVKSPFRTIEEGIRLMDSWSRAWLAFRNAPSFSSALKARFLASAHAQAKHLMAHTSRQGNFTFMEMAGVYTYATLFPQNEDSASFRRESAARLFAALKSQILPDGLQYELTPNYHMVVVNCSAGVCYLARQFGREQELPSEMLPLLRRACEATLAMMAPGFNLPSFNDTPSRRTIETLACVQTLFPHHQELVWAATEGRKGRPPAGKVASRFLPWSGFAVMRSGWDRDASYLAFDVGPLGNGHCHWDKLSFTLWKGDEELVFDDGGGRYDDSPQRRYAVSGYGHNTMLVDGTAQTRSHPKVLTASVDADWEASTTADHAAGIYDQEFGRCRSAMHRRTIDFDKKADVFTVVDEAKSRDGAEHEYTLLFHLDTLKVDVAPDGRSLRARFGRKWDLEMDLSADRPLKIEVVSGRLKPFVAGWHMRNYEGAADANTPWSRPSSTVFVRAAKGKDCRFVTRLHPVKAIGPAR